MEEFLNTLTDDELLVTYCYKFKNLSSEKQAVFLKILNTRGLKERAPKEKLEKKPTNAVCCTRCNSEKLIVSRTPDLHNLAHIFLALTYAPASLRTEYECILCGQMFKKRLSLQEILSIIN